jgi:hypothetical protein
VTILLIVTSSARKHRYADPLSPKVDLEPLSPVTLGGGAKPKLDLKTWLEEKFSAVLTVTHRQSNEYLSQESGAWKSLSQYKEGEISERENDAYDHTQKDDKTYAHDFSVLTS